MRKEIVCLLLLSILVLVGNATPSDTFAGETEFGQFALVMPSGWDGQEDRGFVSGNDSEYILSLGRKDEDGERFLSQVSIYLLPNKPGVDARTAARTLSESQGNATEPEQVGNLWQFSGEPRSRTVKGIGKTLVNADSDYLLIIISQDEMGLGADEILESLRGLTPVAKRLWGR